MGLAALRWGLGGVLIGHLSLLPSSVSACVCCFWVLVVASGGFGVLRVASGLLLVASGCFRRLLWWSLVASCCFWWLLRFRWLLAASPSFGCLWVVLAASGGFWPLLAASGWLRHHMDSINFFSSVVEIILNTDRYIFEF